MAGHSISRAATARRCSCCKKAVSIAPDHAVLRWHLGQVYADLGRKAEAAIQIQAALADPSFQDRDAAQAVLKTLA